MLIDEGKCIDYRGIIIMRLNRGRADITGNKKKMRNPSSLDAMPVCRYDQFNVRFRFKKTPGDKAKHSTR